MTEADPDRPDRRSRRLQRLAVVVALLALPIGGLLLWELTRPLPVTAGFTRVGGATRVETAAYAARFWLTTPTRVIMVSATAHAPVVLHAADCAIASDAPLLFEPWSAERKTVVERVLARWRLARDDVTHVKTVKSGCPRLFSTPVALHTLEGNEEFLPNERGINGRDHLAPFVVFASSKDPSVPGGNRRSAGSEHRDLPDVAVGLALAAHLARTSRGSDGVSIVVVPRYLEADPELEERLRDERHRVVGGLVLGEKGRISEETRFLLRQILRPFDRTTLLSEARTSLGSAGTAIAALLALAVGSVAAARSVPTLVRNITSQVDTGGRPVRIRRQTVTEGAPSASRGAANGSSTRPRDASDERGDTTQQDATRRDPFGLTNRTHTQITLYLDGGSQVTGVYEAEEKLGDVACLKMSDSSVAGVDGEPMVEAPILLVPVHRIELAAAHLTSIRPAATAPADGEKNEEEGDRSAFGA